MATGQRGIVGPADGRTWDSCQLRLIYEYPDSHEDRGKSFPPFVRGGQGGAIEDKDSKLKNESRRAGSKFEKGREAAVDIHTSWATPDNCPGCVEPRGQR